MSRKAQYQIVLVTCGSAAEGRRIARTVVSKRLAACVNLVGARVESVYWWNGRLETGTERLLIMKTNAKRAKELEAEVRRLHSYDVPEFLVIKIDGGSKEYLEWVGNSLGPRKKKEI